MQIGRTIRIYLANGEISGIRHAEIVNWTGQAILAPRNRVNDLKTWQESQKPGVYFLFGINEETGKSSVYIGEAENVFTRLSNHILNKDFWNEVIFYTNKDENLTKAHVKYLESRLCQLASSANRYYLENGNEPQLPALPRGDRDAMEEFINNINILLGVMGHRVLESYSQKEIISNKSNIKSNNKSDNLLFLIQKNVSAKAVQTDEGLVVLTDSKISDNIKDSLSSGYRNLRESLIQNGVICKVGDELRFKQDQLFSSPSQAAAIAVGYPMNGRLCWKTEDGKTIQEIEELNIRI